jgi:hypothetical protein
MVTLTVKIRGFVVVPEIILGDIQLACGLPIERESRISAAPKEDWCSGAEANSFEAPDGNSHVQERQLQIETTIFDGRGKELACVDSRPDRASTFGQVRNFAATRVWKLALIQQLWRHCRQFALVHLRFINAVSQLPVLCGEY